jgi:alpha-tubulin suppressor-like RCC1 family protein
LNGPISTPTSQPFPTEMADKNENIKEMAPGFYHSAMLFKDRSAYGFGGNWLGQYGDGTTSTKPIPSPVSFSLNKDVKKIASGAYHTLFLQNGTIFVTGQNNVIYFS